MKFGFRDILWRLSFFNPLSSPVVVIVEDPLFISSDQPVQPSIAAVESEKNVYIINSVVQLVLGQIRGYESTKIFSHTKRFQVFHNSVLDSI